MFKFAPYALPWWTALIASFIMILWLANVTVPAWALITHMRPSAKDAEIGDISTHGGKSKKGRTQAMVMEEINRLQEELQNMQNE